MISNELLTSSNLRASLVYPSLPKAQAFWIMPGGEYILSQMHYPKIIYFNTPGWLWLVLIDTLPYQPFHGPILSNYHSPSPFPPSILLENRLFFGWIFSFYLWCSLFFLSPPLLRHPSPTIFNTSPLRVSPNRLPKPKKQSNTPLCFFSVPIEKWLTRIAPRKIHLWTLEVCTN